MDLQLQNKRALVTGASSGIGRAIGLCLASEGVQLCVTARRQDLLHTLSEEITRAGGKTPCLIVQDMMEDGAGERIAEAATYALGAVDILMNCAGGSRLPVPVEDQEPEWEEMMRLNFERVRQLTHALVPEMVRQGWGRVVNISGKSEFTTFITASSAKAALHAWSKGLSLTVGRHGVTVNCIQPGRIMSDQIRRKYSDAFRAEQSAGEIPVGRYGEPEELATLAAYIASPLASYITGTVIPVDGGLRRYAF